MDRNYAAEMRAVIDEATSHGPYSSPTIAEQIAEKLRANDPDLLHGWLDQQAVQFIRVAINERDHSNRVHARAVAGRSVFREASAAFEAGDSDALGAFLNTVYVVEDGTRVRLSEMTKPDLLFAADGYGRRAAEHLLQESFLRALAKKVGTRRVADVFDEDKLNSLWRSISAR
jgi:hypothetical protein